MSAQEKSNPLREDGAASKSKKKKNKKKAAAGAEKKAEETTVNGNNEPHDSQEEAADADDHPNEPVLQHAEQEPDDVDDDQPLSPTIQSNGTNLHSISSAVALGLSRSRSQGALSPSPPPDAAARLDALAQERDTLRQEVTELRKSLESIQGKHEKDISTLHSELEDVTESRDHFERQYRNLAGKISSIRNTLGDRLKEDAARLEEAHAQISELEQQNRELQGNNDSLTEQLANLRKEQETHDAELAKLRKQASLSQQNWIAERDELISREAYAKEEFENARQAMQDWEALALNERSLNQNLKEKAEEFEEQLETLKEAHARALSERDQNSEAVEGLQKALQRLQTERKNERRELVENHQSELDRLRKQAHEAEEAAQNARVTLDKTQKELERALPFEKEVKEKNLLIGKLRHEAVTLNEHLTKALKILKKGRPEDNIDRQLVTNFFLQFLVLDRADPKKFEALQLIASLLNWDDEQREKAGLARPGASSSGSSLRIPLSPFRRTPSTPSLNGTLQNDPLLSESSSSNKESLAEMWSDFLRREAAEGESRRGSQATSTPPPPPRSQSMTGLGLSEK